MKINVSFVCLVLGHLLSEHGIGPTESKVQDILNARRPESAAEVRSFLGLVNFSARYIKDLSTVAEPLRKFTRQGIPFKWGRKEEESFNELKRRLANSETLGYFDKNAKTKVISDASPVGLGAVLVQDQGGELRVISYASRTLSKIERKYSQTEKEALGIVWACERFHMYLFGQEFELLTDHKPLEFIFSPKSKPCAHVERWVLRLQQYNYTVCHISGSTNIADSLSRLLKKSEERTENTETEEYLRTIVENATPMAMNLKDIEKASREDEVFENVKTCIMTSDWSKLKYKGYLMVKDELCAVGDIILRGTRIVIPETLRAHVLKLGHEGHPGIVVMKQRLRTKVWWPGIDKAVERSCRTCYGCQLMGKPNRPEPMKRTELPTGPWEQILCHFLGPLPSKDNLLVITDYYSRWIEVIILKSTTADKTVEALNRVFCMHGFPVSITTDNNPQFISQTFKDYMEEHGIFHRKVTPLWPEANGEVERQNRSILKRLRIAQAERKNWKEELQTYLLMYRSTPHTVTGVSPAEMLFRRKLRTKLPELSDHQGNLDSEIRDRDKEQKEKGKLYADEKRKAQESGLKVGDKVLLNKKVKENKMSTENEVNPYSVISKRGNSVGIESESGVIYKRNVTHLRKFHESNQDIGENVSNHSEQEIQDKNSSESLDIYVGDSSIDTNMPDVISAGIQSPTPVVVPSTPTKTRVPTTPPEPPDRPVRERKVPTKFKDFIMN